jgi:hypothetical protein
MPHQPHQQFNADALERLVRYGYRALCLRRGTEVERQQRGWLSLNRERLSSMLMLASLRTRRDAAGYE